MKISDYIYISVFAIFTVIIYEFILYIYGKLMHKNRINNIRKLTDEWIYNVTVLNDPNKVYNMFCNKSKLLGTVSKIFRTNIKIKEYFDFFAKLPNIRILNKEYNIIQLNDNIYVNTALIKWKWDGVEPTTARMTFIFKNNCIVQLHSSKLPDPPEELSE